MKTSETPAFGVLIVAKAPVPGLVKTRLCPPLNLSQAADIAAAALLDTLTAASVAVGGERSRITVALDGHISDASRGPALSDALADCTVISQRGRSFGERLMHAHHDASAQAPGAPVLQVGMDTPQLTPDALIAAAHELADSGIDAVLGPALDGGWWLLGLQDPAAAEVLRNVPMSTAATGQLTDAALQGAGLRVRHIETMRDVDAWSDALLVAGTCSATHFARAVCQVAA